MRLRSVDDMDLDQLWIGDVVRITSSGRLGTFAGIKDGLALVKCGDAMMLVAADDLTLYEGEDRSDPDLAPKAQELPRTRDKLFVPELDLHLEALGEFDNSGFPTALDYQLSRLRSFLASALAHRAREVTIIHGKGQGVLSAAVQDLLAQHEEIETQSPLHDGGAVRVRFR